MPLLLCLAGADKPDLAKLTDFPQEFCPADYKAEVGDRGTLNADSDINVCRDFAAFEDYYKAVNANDRVGMKDLLYRGKIMVVKPGTWVLVVKNHDFGDASDGPPCSEIRIMDGPFADKIGWVSRRKVQQRIPFPVRVGKEGVLDATLFGDGTVTIAANPDSYDRFVEAYNDHDVVELQEMLARQMLALSPSGARVKVLAVCIGTRFKELAELDNAAIKVEVLSGSLKGKQGWVSPDVVKESRAPARK